jgi:mitotic spindle assembly checkpoint protein MAD1
MDDSDESTAVFAIKKNFNEFISGMSGSSFNSQLHFEDDKPLQQQAELLSTRSRLSHIQMQLSSAEASRKRARIEHDRDLDGVKKEQLRELEKMADLKRQLVRVACKEELARQELTDTKKAMDASIAELQNKLTVMQKEKLQLENILEEMKQDTRSKLSELNMENGRLLLAVQKGQNELHEVRQLLQIARRESGQSSKLQLELLDAQTKLATCEQKIKEQELMMSRAEEDLKLGKAMKSQLSHLGQLEIDNKKLQEENQYLKAVQENSLVLREECESLRKKLERADERCVRLSTLEVEHEDVKKRLAEWEAVECSGLSGLRTPAQLSRTLAELQRNNELLLEKNGQLQARFNLLEAESQAMKQQLQTLQTDFAMEHSKHQLAIDTVKRLNKKLLLVSKEKEGYKNIIDSYESELTMSVGGKSDIKVRQSLEEALESQRQHCASLESELEKVNQQLAQYKTRAVLLERQLIQLREQNSSTQLPSGDATDCNQNIVIELRNRVADLEKNVEALTVEKENLMVQLERFDIQGEYDRSKTKVVQYSMNPFSVANRKLTSDLNQLREQNTKLLQRLKILEESKGNVEDLTARVDERLLQTGCGTKVEDIKAQLASAELKNKRLMEVFKKTSQELREVSYQLLGFRIDMPTTGQYRLMNMYAESPNDYFIFKQTSGGELQLLANDYSASFPEKINTYLHIADSIPAFLSSITLELFNRQTFVHSN